MVYALSLQQILLAELARDGIVECVGEFLAPTVETKIENLRPVVAHKRDTAVVACPGVVGLTAAQSDVGHTRSV